MWKKQISGKVLAAGVVCIMMLSLFVFSLGGTGRIQENAHGIEKGEPMQLWIISDIHLLSPALTDGGSLFTRTVENGDGKMVGDSAEIVDALVGKAVEEKPDALIVSGDLTFNGERESLEFLAGRLDRIQEAGVSVLVIPGNHDIENPYAYRYEGGAGGDGGADIGSGFQGYLWEIRIRSCCGKGQGFF